MGGGGRVEEVTRGREGVRVAKGKRKRERGNNRIKSAKRDPGRESNKRKTGRCEKQQSRTQKAAAQVTGPRNGKGGREDGRGKEEEGGRDRLAENEDPDRPRKNRSGKNKPKYNRIIESRRGGEKEGSSKMFGGKRRRGLLRRDDGAGEPEAVHGSLGRAAVSIF